MKWSVVVIHGNSILTFEHTSSLPVDLIKIKKQVSDTLNTKEFTIKSVSMIKERRDDKIIKRAKRT